MSISHSGRCAYEKEKEEGLLTGKELWGEWVGSPEDNEIRACGRRKAAAVEHNLGREKEGRPSRSKWGTVNTPAKQGITNTATDWSEVSNSNCKLGGPFGPGKRRGGKP